MRVLILELSNTYISLDSHAQTEEAMEGLTAADKWGLGIPACRLVYLITANTAKKFGNILRLKMSCKAGLCNLPSYVLYNVYPTFNAYSTKLYTITLSCCVNPRTQPKRHGRASCSHPHSHERSVDSPTMPTHSRSCNRANCLSLCTIGRFSVAYSFRHYRY